MSPFLSALSLAVLAVGTIASPILLESRLEPRLERRSSVGPKPGMNATKEDWCPTPSFEDPEDARIIWEDWAVGYWLANWNQGAIDPPDDNWPQKLYEAAVKSGGDSNLGSCGTVGASCNIALDCHAMFESDFPPQAYWALRGLSGFHDYLDAAHTKLVEAALGRALNVKALVRDFSADETYQTAGDLALIFGAAFFLVGGLAGAASLGAGAVAGAVEASVQSAVAVTKAAAQAAVKKADELSAAGASGAGKASEAARKAQARADAAAKTEASSGRVVENIKTGESYSNVLGAGSYLLGSSFYEISAAADPQGQVDEATLDQHLDAMFQQGIEQLELIGQLVAGVRKEGGPGYEALPYADGTSGPTHANDPIAGYMSDGKFLVAMGASDWDKGIEATWDLFGKKLVDLSLQMGGFEVVAQENLPKDMCLERYGAQWVRDMCFRIFKNNGENKQTCNGSSGQRVLSADGIQCQWSAADDEIYNKIQKWGINVAEYYEAAYRCAAEGDRDAEGPLPVALDGVISLCWYNPIAKRGKFGTTLLNGRAEIQSVIWSDFDRVEGADE